MSAIVTATHQLTKKIGRIKKTATGIKKTAKSHHPTYVLMCEKAMSEIKDRKGTSRQAIFKWIDEKYNIGEDGRRHVNMALKKGVLNNLFTSPASGRYRLGAKKSPEKKEKTVVEVKRKVEFTKEKNSLAKVKGSGSVEQKKKTKLVKTAKGKAKTTTVIKKVPVKIKDVKKVPTTKKIPVEKKSSKKTSK